MLDLLPKYANVEVLKPGARTGRGGNPHHYLVDGKKYRRVTTILDQTIPKPSLIYWAKNVALEKVRAELVDLGTLQVGRDEVVNLYPDTINELIEAARNRPDEVKNEAADWGTGAHQAIQDVIEGRHAWDVPDIYQPALAAFNAFQAEHAVTWLATEMTVWSDHLEVAGTVDAVGRTKDGLVVFDWKTSKGLYHEHALQVSAYAVMLSYLVGEPVARAYVVRFPREQPLVDCPGPNSFTSCLDERLLTAHPCTLCGVYEGEPGKVPGPSFEVKEIADIWRGWDRYYDLVRQANYLKSKVWKETPND